MVALPLIAVSGVLGVAYTIAFGAGAPAALCTVTCRSLAAAIATTPSDHPAANIRRRMLARGRRRDPDIDHIALHRSQQRQQFVAFTQCHVMSAHCGAQYFH